MIETSVIIFLIVFIIITVILLVLFFLGYFTPKEITYNKKTKEEYENEYIINSVWGWDPNNNKSVNIIIPCSLYTFISDYDFEPATISYSKLSNNQNLTKGTGAYADQLFAEKVQHYCFGDTLSTKTSGMCLQQDGTYVKAGTIEQFYQPCDTTTKPDGTLNLIVFNLKQNTYGVDLFNGAFCMQTPNIVTEPMLQNSCSVKNTVTIDNGIYPSQLFVVINADLNGSTFSISEKGLFAKIINRPSGYALTPDIVNKTLILKKQLSNSGYYWVLTPEIINNSNIAPPQIVYIPINQAKNVVALITDPNKLWAYLITSLSIQLNGDNFNVPLKLGNFLYFDKKTNISTKYLSYALLNTILESPKKYGI